MHILRLSAQKSMIHRLGHQEHMLHNNSHYYLINSEYQDRMINLRRINSIFRRFLTCPAPKILPSAFKHAYSPKLSPLISANSIANPSLTIRNRYFCSAFKELSQEDAEYIQKLYKQANTYFQVQNYDEARKVIKLMIELLLKNGQTNILYVDILILMGQCYRSQNKLVDAFDYFDKAVKVLDSLQGNFMDQRPYLRLIVGEILFFKQDYDKAETQLKENLQFLKQNKFEWCTALYILGKINLVKEKYDDAIQLFVTQLKTLRQFFEIKQKYAIASYHSLCELGKCYVQTGNFQQALASCLQAKIIFQAEGFENSIQFAVNLNNLGFIYKSLNQIQQFLDCSEKALAIQEKIIGMNNPKLQKFLLELGFGYFQAKKPEQALPYLQRYLQIFYSQPNGKKDAQFANALLAVVKIRRNKQNSTEAIKQSKQSTDIKKEDILKNLSTILNLKTELQYNHLLFSSSLNYAMMCLRDYRENYGQQSPKNAEILLTIAILYDKLGKQAQCLAYIEQAESLLEQQGNSKKQL